MPILWGLKMSTSKKIALTGIFGIGIAYDFLLQGSTYKCLNQCLHVIFRVCVFTLYRIWITVVSSSGDTKTAFPVIGELATIEALSGIINACLPVLAPVFSKIRRSAPKKVKHNDGNQTDQKNNTTSGSIPILLRVSHLWSKSLGRYTSSDKEPWPPKTHDDYSPIDAEERNLREPKVNRITGMKVPEIYVRKDVDVESDLCNDQAPLGEQTAGDHTRW